MTHQSTNPLTALAISPLETYMDVQGDNEEVKLIVRRHALTNLGWILVTGILLVLPFALLSNTSIDFFGLRDFLDLLSDKVKTAMVIVWYLYLFLFALQNAVLWFFNVLVVTNERMVDLDVAWPFRRFVTETRLTQVQDVSFKQGGFLAGIFDYGDVYVQTAGVEQNIEILRAPNPAFIHDKITDIVQEFGGNT